MSISFSSNVKGVVQLVIVAGFVVLSFITADMLKTSNTSPDSSSNDDKRSLMVQTSEILSQSYRRRYETTGIVETRLDIDVVPQVSGRIVAVHPEFYEGGYFKEGDVLVEIDPRDYELEIERLQAEVARAQTLLQLEQAERKAALSEWTLINPNKKAPSLVARAPQIREAQANLSASKAQLKQAELNLERTKISMPFSGRVLSSMAAEGRFISSGQMIGQVFNSDLLEINISLPAEKLAWIKQDEDSVEINVTVKDDSRSLAQSYEAYVLRSAASVNPDTRFADVKLGFREEVDVLPGIFVSVDIKGPELNNVYVLPSSALQKNRSVWAVSQDNRLTLLQANIIDISDEYVAVSGLSGVQDIVISTIQGATQGMEVTRMPLSTSE